MTAKRKRPVSEDTGNWTELKFERSGGFKTKYHSPTLKSSKYGVHLYKTDLQADQNVKLFKNGTKVGIVADDTGDKKLKANKSGSRVSVNGRKVVKELGIEPGIALAGTKGEIMGKSGWIFE